MLYMCFPSGSDGKESTWMQVTRDQSLGWEEPLEQEMLNIYTCVCVCVCVCAGVYVKYISWRKLRT